VEYTMILWMRVIGSLPLRTRKPRESIGESVLFAFDIVKYRRILLFEEEAPSNHALIGEWIVDEIVVVCVNVQFTIAI
jgi:hypothetical protein